MEKFSPQLEILNGLIMKLYNSNAPLGLQYFGLFCMVFPAAKQGSGIKRFLSLIVLSLGSVLSIIFISVCILEFDMSLLLMLLLSIVNLIICGVSIIYLLGSRSVASYFN